MWDRRLCWPLTVPPTTIQSWEWFRDFQIARLEKMVKLIINFTRKMARRGLPKKFQSSSYKFHHLKLLHAIATWFKLQSYSSLNQFVEHLLHSLKLLATTVWPGFFDRRLPHDHLCKKYADKSLVVDRRRWSWENDGKWSRNDEKVTCLWFIRMDIV